MDDKKNALRVREGREYSTINELVTEVSRIIPHFASEQKKGSVSVYPDERTIRYYMSAGLVDKPVKRRAGSSVFTYRHLLQVLSIKYLQSDYYPLPKIRGLLSAADEKMMEKILLAGGVDPMTVPSRIIGRRSMPPSERSKSVREFSESCIEVQPAVMRSDEFIPPKKPAMSTKEPVKEWMRIDVREGVELNVDSGFLQGSKAEKKEFLEKLAARIRVLIQNEKNREGRKDDKVNE